MSSKKIIAITGATGAQGGGMARAILNDRNSEFAVRAIARDPDSEKAKILSSMGAEVVKADLYDLASLEKAFEGAWGAYCVTFFWAHMSAEKEQTEARNIAKAVKKAGVQHAIWSTFEDTREYIPLSDNRMPTLQGKYKVPHFDAKNEANAYFTELGIPTTFLYTSFYWENLIYFGAGPAKGPDGKLYFSLPLGDKKMPSMTSEDIGKCSYGIFKRGKEFIGKTVGVAGEHLTGYQFASSLSKALGKEVIYNKVSPDEYRAFGFPGADEMGNMCQFKADFEEIYCGHRDLALCRELNPELMSFDQWLTINAGKIPLG